MQDIEDVFGRIKSTLMRQHAERNGVEVGKRKCEHCGAVSDWDGAPACDCDDRIEREQQAAALEAVRHCRLTAAYNSIPKGMRWSRAASPEFAKRVPHGGLVSMVRNWTRQAGSVAILGPTGIGKTAAAVALMHRILDAAKTGKRSRADVNWASEIRFVSTLALIVDRRNTALGSEAPLVESAKECSLLVLDEVGFEDPSYGSKTVLLEIIDHRYLGELPTILTSGLTEPEFQARYGAAMLRRITDRGNLIDGWPKAVKP